jgi:hypothetical protein
MGGIGHFEPEEFHFIVFRGRALDIFPPWEIRSSAILPFIDINGFIAHGFYIIVDGELHAADGREDADDAENAECDAEEGQKCAEFVGTKFLQGHFETGPDDVEIFNDEQDVKPKHNVNIQDRFQPATQIH